MSTDFRYELKFILDDRRLTQAHNWILTETRASPRYAPRTVNSLYYDSANLQALQDNLHGLSDRTKYRLRWYDDGDHRHVNGVCFEAKKRQGRLNRKLREKLPGLSTALREHSHHQIRAELLAHINDSPGLETIPQCFPTLQVRYLREYFEDAQGIRITLDQQIDFHLTPLNANLYFGQGIRHPWSVMEVKFPTSQKIAVANSLRRFRLSPKRHSKYIAGLAAFGQAVYF